MENKDLLKGKRILVTGGTGSLGKALVRRILSGAHGKPERVTVYSRDEAKQHFMRLEYMGAAAATDEVIYENSKDVLSFTIGDVRDYPALTRVLKDTDIVFHAAALKQVPSCEYFPFEAILTNVYGSQNIVRAIGDNALQVQKVIGISTDKACKPVNVMGMTKALQERVLIEANRGIPGTAFCCVRYGNVIASRGSIVPLFIEQAKNGKPLTVTMPEMTRFLLSLAQAVDTVLAALEYGNPGETFVPKVRSARIRDVARAIIGDRDLEIVYTGIRPGEKIHEIMVSEEECFRTVEEGGYFIILPVLPELRDKRDRGSFLETEYSSKNDNISVKQLEGFLRDSSMEVKQFQYDS